MPASHSLHSSRLNEPAHIPAPGWTVVTLGILGLFFNVWTIFIGFHHSLYDLHGFRQTQTALNVESLLRGDSFLRYQTPVLGPPWAIPFEFPLYQGIVAGVMRLLETHIEETGRAVSILFFYLCFFPLTSILHRLRFRSIQIVSVLAILAVSPLYIFFSRVFMIESTALFFSLMYTEQMFRLTMGEQPWQYRHMIGSAALGILGGLIKVTTFAPYYVLGVGLAAWQGWQLYRNATIRIRRIGAAAFFSGLLPMAATDLWTKFADSMKAQNPFGVALTSKALKYWNFGTIAQRLQPRWYHLLESRIHLQIGYSVAWVLIAGVYAGMLILGLEAWRFRRWNIIVVTCVALYVGTTMLFFNLHAVHEYYPYSTALFLIVAVGALIAPFLELPGRKAWIGVALLVVEMGACVSSYFRHYYPIQSHDYPGRPAAAAVVDRTTSAQSVILVTGLDWSSEFPYQSGRRAITDANFGYRGHPSELGPVQQAIEKQGPRTIAAVIACDLNRDTDRLKLLLQTVGMNNPKELHGDDCDIYERPAEQQLPERR